MPQSRRDDPERARDESTALASSSGVLVAGSAEPRQRRTILLLLIAATGLALDLVTKIIAVETLSGAEPVRLLGGAVYLTLTRNSGAAFSMGQGMTVVFTIVMIVVIAAVVTIASRVRAGWWAVSLGLILAGAAGNLIDRLLRHPGPFRGAVIDFISVFDPWGRAFPIFNVADSCIVVGGIIAVVLAFLGVELDGTRHRSASPRPDSAG